MYVTAVLLSISVHVYRAHWCTEWLYSHEDGKEFQIIDMIRFLTFRPMTTSWFVFKYVSPSCQRRVRFYYNGRLSKATNRLQISMLSIHHCMSDLKVLSTRYNCIKVTIVTTEAFIFAISSFLWKVSCMVPQVRWQSFYLSIQKSLNGYVIFPANAINFT
jgi:hypothetical protein